MFKTTQLTLRRQELLQYTLENKKLPKIKYIIKMYGVTEVTANRDLQIIKSRKEVEEI